MEVENSALSYLAVVKYIPAISCDTDTDNNERKKRSVFGAHRATQEILLKIVGWQKRWGRFC